MQGGAAKRQVRVSIAPNPSHLEAVNAVVAGLVRAEQSRLPLARRSQVCTAANPMPSNMARTEACGRCCGVLVASICNTWFFQSAQVPARPFGSEKLQTIRGARSKPSVASMDCIPSSLLTFAGHGPARPRRRRLRRPRAGRGAAADVERAW